MRVRCFIVVYLITLRTKLPWLVQQHPFIFKLFIMQKNLLKAFCCTLLAMLTLQLSAQDFKWSVNKKARPYLEKGIDYVINNENEQAYPELMQAIRLYPTCSIALFYLSTLTRGDAHKDYVARTKSSLRGKPEEEKAFFALVDSPSRQQANSMLFEKMHTLYPANFLFSYYYSITRPGDEKSFVATQELIRQFPNEGAPYHNLAYMYLHYQK